MKIALLVCDHVAEPFRGPHGTYPEMFGKFLDVPMNPFFVCDGEFPIVDSYDAFICTGSRFSVYDDLAWVQQLKDLVKVIFDRQKKFVGICFGHQMMAEALGGKVQKAGGGYMIGVHTFNVLENESFLWMQPRVPSYNILMLCQDQVMQPPPQSKVISHSPECTVGMFTVGAHFLGFQGHPEFTKDYNRDVFQSRVDRIGDAKVESAMASLEQSVDQELLRQWILRFLQTG